MVLRLVSLVASLVAMATLGLIVVRETGDRVAGLLAAGLFAATFRISGAWFDTGRVDSLSLAITLLAIAWGVRARGVRGGLALGLISFLAYFTKQSALVTLVPVLCLVAIRRPRAGLAALGALVVLLAGSTVALDALTRGWYRYYVLDELAGQPWAQPVWVSFWTRDLLAHMWPVALVVAAGASVAAFGSRPRTWSRSLPLRSLRSPAAYHAVAAAGLLASAWVSRLHTGGYENVLMPAYAGVALLAGLAHGVLARARLAAIAAAGVILLQFALLAYPIGAQLPTAADRAAGEALIARLRSLPGPVLVLRHPWYATVAGRGSFAQGEAIDDVLRSRNPRGARALRASLPHALNADGIRAVVLDGGFDAPLLGPELLRDFRLERRPVTPTRLYPLTDLRTSPTLLYARARGG